MQYRFPKFKIFSKNFACGSSESDIAASSAQAENKDVKAAFEKAIENLTGVDYEPIAVLGEMDDATD